MERLRRTAAQRRGNGEVDAHAEKVTAWIRGTDAGAHRFEAGGGREARRGLAPLQREDCCARTKERRQRFNPAERRLRRVLPREARGRERERQQGRPEVLLGTLLRRVQLHPPA